VQLSERLADFKQFKQKESPENALALFIDGYYTEVKDKEKVKSLCICGFRVRLRGS
jgi:hypothetical protein